MRYVNGVLGYVLLVFGVLIGASGSADAAGGVISIAGAILIIGERLCDHLRAKSSRAE